MEHRVVTVGDYTNWRTIEGGPCFHNRKEHEICVNGVIYYTTWVENYYTDEDEDEEEEGELCLAAFDVISEKFQVVKISMQGRFDYSPYTWRYVEFEGKVAVVDSPNSNRECCYGMEHALELWVLEDFQNQICTLKISVLPPSPMKMDNPCSPRHQFVSTSFAGELVFAVFEQKDHPPYLSWRDHKTQTLTGEEDVPFSLLFFDMNTQQFWSSEVHLPPEFPMRGLVRITAVGHVETLLSVT